MWLCLWLWLYFRCTIMYNGSTIEVVVHTCFFILVSKKDRPYTNWSNNGQPLQTDWLARMDRCAKYETLHKSSPSLDFYNRLVLIEKWSWDRLVICDQSRYWKIGGSYVLVCVMSNLYMRKTSQDWKVTASYTIHPWISMWPENMPVIHGHMSDE